MVRAIARRRNGLVAELLGHFGNAASVRARRRPAGGNLTTGPRVRTTPEKGGGLEHDGPDRRGP
ncbi:hypothetical protein CG717_26800 [Streptomyces sp. CB02613]|nr:hypothetical protein CG717_26800 [Streptomyces sp. CB02613]